MAVSLLRKNSIQILKTKFFGNFYQIAKIANHERSIIGKREVVGWGYNGQPYYVDNDAMPFPAIRWKEPTHEIEALREKEKGDWNELTCEEKKALYRASFCQTFPEFLRSNEGEWKTTLSYTFLLMTAGIWIFFLFKCTIYKDLGWPDTFDDDRREAQFRRMLDLKMNPVLGIASKWDYQKDNWK